MELGAGPSWLGPRLQRVCAAFSLAPQKAASSCVAPHSPFLGGAAPVPRAGPLRLRRSRADQRAGVRENSAQLRHANLLRRGRTKNAGVSVRFRLRSEVGTTRRGFRRGDPRLSLNPMVLKPKAFRRV